MNQSPLTPPFITRLRLDRLQRSGLSILCSHTGGLTRDSHQSTAAKDRQAAQLPRAVVNTVAIRLSGERLFRQASTRVPKSECLTTTWEGGSNTSPSTPSVIGSAGRISSTGVNGSSDIRSSKVRDIAGAPPLNLPVVSAPICPALPFSANKPIGSPGGDSHRVPAGLTESNVTAQRLVGQTGLCSTDVLLNEQESGMAEGGGGVRRVTQLPVVTSRALRDHIYVVTRDGRPTLQAQRELRVMANRNVDASDIADGQAALAKHLLGAISFGPNTDRYLENVGLKVVKLRRSRSGIPYHEQVAAGGPEGG